jgi:hypothetical protein
LSPCGIKTWLLTEGRCADRGLSQELDFLLRRVVEK